MTRDQDNDDRGTGRIEAFSDGVIALAIVLSLLNVELSLAFYIIIDLMYGLPIHLLRFGMPDYF